MKNTSVTLPNIKLGDGLGGGVKLALVEFLKRKKKNIFQKMKVFAEPCIKMIL